MRVGILTYHRAHNYGAFIQSYCLSSILKDSLKCDVEIIDYTSKKNVCFYRREIFRDKNLRSIIFNFRKYTMFNKAIHKLPLSSQTLISDNIEKFVNYIQNKYDVIIVGSDEIWKIDSGRGFPNAYWLPGVNSCVKMSYAASSRTDIDLISDEQKYQIKQLLESFYYISVRDEATKKMIDTISNKSASLVCDPTMAYPFKFDINEGRRLLKEKFNVDATKRCLGVMVNNPGLAEQIRRQSQGLELVSLFYSYKGYKNNPNITPFEWVQIIGALDGLITTFFHGMCISINANRPFLIIEQRHLKDDRYSKSYDLLSRHDRQKYYLRTSDNKVKEKAIKDFIRDLNANNFTVDFSDLKRNEANTIVEIIELLKNWKGNIYQ